MKQVIVVRKDLNMRKGKMIAQGAHASVSVVVELAEEKASLGRFAKSKTSEAFDKWLDTGQKKIAVSVDSEKELGSIYQKAIDKGMPASIITDAGHTEFGGVPTKTAVAIGPWDDEEIDEITGDLKLL